MNQFNGDSDYDKSEAGRKIFQAKKGLNQIKEAEIEFTSSRKLASMVVKHGDGVRIYTKGAPEMLFEKLAGCSMPMVKFSVLKTMLMSQPLLEKVKTLILIFWTELSNISPIRPIELSLSPRKI